MSPSFVDDSDDVVVVLFPNDCNTVYKVVRNCCLERGVRAWIVLSQKHCDFDELTQSHAVDDT